MDQNSIASFQYHSLGLIILSSFVDCSSSSAGQTKIRQNMGFSRTSPARTIGLAHAGIVIFSVLFKKRFSLC